MTTAHRPTWNSAQGGSEQGGNLLVNPSRAYSSKDLPAHTKLKVRTGEQLPDNQKLHQPEKIGQVFDQAEQGEENEFKVPDASLITKNDVNNQETQQLLGKRRADHQLDLFEKVDLRKSVVEQEDDEDPDCSHDSKKDESQKEAAKSSDNEDDHEDEDDDESGEGEDDSQDEESDDELELLREYEKLKKEREQQRVEAELERQRQLEKEQQEQVLYGNPLLNQQLADAQKKSKGDSGIYTLKRKWHDETVFKHQARNDPSSKDQKKRFINDTVRSDFHRKFLSRAIQ